MITKVLNICYIFRYIISSLGLPKTNHGRAGGIYVGDMARRN